MHTTSSETDWKEFSRARDPHCLKSLCLPTGTSFVETCIASGLTTDPQTGRPLFGQMNTFVSYTWRGDGISLGNMVRALEPIRDVEDLFFFIFSMV